MKMKLITLPNIITLGNLLCGTLGIVSMVSLQSAQALHTAFVFMLAAALCDFWDGFVARITGQYSSIGAQLDSLADLVSFGVLPTLIAMKVCYLAGGTGAWSAVMLLIVVCAALRLARFNVSDDQKSEFVGLPVPACALLIGSVGWYFAGEAGAAWPDYLPWVVLAGGVVLAGLMVSPLRMFALKFEGFGFAANAVRYTFLFMALVLILLFDMAGIGLAVVLYILVSLGLGLVRGRRNR